MATRKSSILVWDLPTRIFHWLFVASFGFAWATHEDNRYLYFHVVAGYFFFGLLIFRVIWGIVGSRYARFTAFAYRWTSATAYWKALLNGSAARHIGHNPLGSWAIFLMLTLALLISVSGLLVMGGEEGHGPLSAWIAPAIGEAAKELHEGASGLLLFVVIIHIAGVIIESFIHKENLVNAMLTGNKPGAADIKPASPFNLLGTLLIILVVSLGVYAFKGYIAQRPGMPYLPFEGPALPDNDAWRKACGECHLAFHPTLLPARSWVKMMQQQNAHFGEDLGFSKQEIDELTRFMTKYSAESGLSEPARKILARIPPDITPLRITETAYWKRKHDEISDEIWKRPSIGKPSKCEACHWDAQRGTFEDSAMRIPKS